MLHDAMKPLPKLIAACSILFATLLSTTTSFGQAFTSRDVIRLNGSQPIISQQMFIDLGVADEGDNINGPSLIRVPDWIARHNRADPDANYYLYFGNHTGDYIRMAWASDVLGPWTLHNSGSNVAIGDRGVLDNGGVDLNIGMGIIIEENHLASPDVHVDHVNERIIMYFHAGSSTFFNGNEMNGQFTWVSTSPYGLEFIDNIEPVRMSTSYFRQFAHGGELYAFNNSAYPRRALDPLNPWQPTPNYYSGSTIPSLWQRHPAPLTQDAIFEATGLLREDLRVRHTAVRVVDDQLQVFYTQRGDSPERVMMSTVDLRVSDWADWEFSYPGEELLQAVSGWEGGQFEPEPSEAASAPEDTNQLRDPFVFEDDDGALYLIYTGRGEDALGIAAMSSPIQNVEVFHPTDDAYVGGGSVENDNFGDAPELQVRQADNPNLLRRALLQFDLTDVNNVDAAVIRLYAGSTSSTSVNISDAASDWTQATVTAANAPMVGQPIASIEIGPDQQWYQWDVTAYVQQNAGGQISFAFDDELQANQTITFSSLEGSHRPELKILLAEEAVDDVVLGDVNADGVVDLLDIAAFVDLIVNGEFNPAADINGDGVVDLLDIGPFVAALTGA